ncbi:MAG: hypothetical protein JNN17_08565 [Verrucomicrobiaceae bacterium]|nr:hypothetical protein [Verrucomicrobiaceae bacterium]
MRLLDARTGWDIFDITLLRPAGWMAEHARRVEGRSEVWVDFEELNARGWAEVIEEVPVDDNAAHGLCRVAGPAKVTRKTGNSEAGLLRSKAGMPSRPLRGLASLHGQRRE